ncbi:MAG: DUF1015 domain-containing protein [Planctomycetota bacterium]
MPQITPFAAVRYNLDHVRSLSDVIAPPYDVIDPQLQDQLYKQHPANVVRIILNRTEPGDHEDEKYQRAADFLTQWLQQGVLQRDDRPALYVYHQTFQVDGQTVNRRGFMARARIQPFGEGNVYPHEETHPKAKVDRLNLTIATKQNNSQIFGLYPDPHNEVISLLDQATKGIDPVQATDHLEVVHRLWPVTDAAVTQRACELMVDKPMFVADGHHRYETASNYRQQLIDASGPLPEEHPANFVMTMLVGMSDPGMIVLPTHRLIRGPQPLSSDQIIEKLSSTFDCAKLPGIESANQAWAEMEEANQQSWIALFAAVDQTWVMAKATDSAYQRIQTLAPQQSDDWRGLGVSLLHRLVIDDLLGWEGHPKPTYVHQVDEVIAALKGEGSQAESDGSEPYSLAALVMPATLAHVEAISLHKERMPAKSTYFYPKLLSGLTFNPLT